MGKSIRITFNGITELFTADQQKLVIDVEYEMVNGLRSHFQTRLGTYDVISKDPSGF